MSSTGSRQIIGVKFSSKVDPGKFRGREYSYWCDIPNVKAGDIVIVSVRDAEQEAMVSKTEIPEETIPLDLRSKLKSVIRKKEDGVAQSNATAAVQAQIIVLRQLPIIEARVQSVRAEIEKKTAQVMSLVCTEDTYRDIKKERAALNKEFEALEAQRKQVKAAIMAPYDEFERAYKECVAEPYKKADADLKKKIDDVESGLKAEKATEAKDYYFELLRAANLDWIAAMGYRPKVTMSVSAKALKEEAKALVDGFVRDVAAIEALPDASEIMVEYRKTLDAAGAIKTVADRHAALEAQRRMDEERRRQKEEQEAAQKRMSETLACESANEAAQKVFEKQPEAIGTDPESPSAAAKGDSEEEPKTPQEKIYMTRFWAKGTLAQLKGLKEYMERNGIDYGTV